MRTRSSELRRIVPIWAVLLIVLSTGVQAQIDINELTHSNSGLVLDEDGDTPDWFELYNTTSSSINVNGYRVTDNNDPMRWTFPSVTIPGGGRLLVFTSGKDRGASQVHHWETAVFEGDAWRYREGSNPVPANWAEVGFNDSGWLVGPGGLGYGDNDDATLIPETALTLYIRRAFNVLDRTKLVTALMSVDYDDGFVAYLNGVEIGRRNIDGVPTNTSLASEDREALVYGGGDYETLSVDPAVLEAALVNGMNVFAIEVHNAVVGSSDMSIRPFLHFGISDASVYFSTPPNFLDPQTTSILHTNFKLGLGETLRLFDTDGLLVSTATIPIDLQPGHSRARLPDGGIFCYSQEPTPGGPNLGTCFTAYASPPVFSLPSGFYPGPQSTAITGTNVRFKIDGSEPTSTSPLYAAPIAITTTRVIRAKSFEFGKLPSITVTANYLLNQTTTLPVVSISADPAILFGPDGVYDNVPIGGGLPRVPCHIQYYDANRNLAFQAPTGFQVIGNFTLLFPQKGIEFTCKDRFGSPETLDYAIFPRDKPGITSFYDFRIKNADNESVRMRDLIANRMAVPTHNITAGFGNVAAFINGEYWGHYNSRERLDENFFASNLGVDPDSVDIVKSVSFTPDFYDASSGTDEAFFAMSDLILDNDMSDPATYAAVAEEIDIMNWIDYYATRIYLSDHDWMYEFQNNTMLMKSHSPNLKWKYILWDCASTQNAEEVSMVDLDYVTNVFDLSPETRHKWMINALLGNTSFHHLFINRFADLMNYYYTTEKIFPIIDENVAEMLPEMNAHNARWGTANMESVQANVVGSLKPFHEQRPGIQRQHLVDYFNLSGQVEITLQAQPAGWGRIRISTIAPMPEELPWTGIYFNGVPVTITAEAEPGYAFVDWDNDPNVIDTLAVSFTRNFTANSNLTANFRVSSTGLPESVLNEVELFPNPSTGLVQLRSDKPLRYTVMDALGRVVLRNSTVQIATWIDLSHQPDGIYSIWLDVGGHQESHRMVKRGG